MSIHQFLEAQSSQNPAAIAIKDAVGELTYKQLNSRTNQLANYLRQQGVQPEVLVGIYTERSIDTAIAILAVLKAGGAYIPLDPAYPKERLGSILEDTKLELILTQSQLAADISSTGINLFLLDTQWAEVATASEDLEPAQTTPENLAYIMYTSGSTGKPQGVQITLRQVECYLKAVNEVTKIQPDDIYLLSASFSFSSSIRQLLLPLSQGAKVVITSKANTSNLRSLLDLIQTEKITVFDTVASVWNYLLICLAEVEQDGGSQLVNAQIRLLVFSGGLLTSQLLNQVRSKFPQPPQIINIYGQTETIGVCAYPIPDNFNTSQGYAPVGSAYPHNQLYVLTEQMQPVSVAETGELYISGSSLARGYLNNPQLNERKFIPNPFATDREELLYKTGDLARYLPDGNLEIVGRQDFQVKIRGMRVEIEEIETVLMQHPDVQQAAVVGKEDRSGEQIIVAYIVSKQAEINISDVRSFLKTKLTDYMMPSAFQILDALPLTPNNKLDRKRLPEPSRENLTIVPPRDELELQLVKIWEKILDIEQIGINDSFFDLGGHSLTALQMVTEVERICKIRLPLAILFESQTIAALADAIRQKGHQLAWSPLVLMKSGINQSPLFCVHPIGGNVLDYYTLSKKLGIDRPVYGLQARGLDGKQPPFDRVQDMASYFIQAIQTVQPHGPYFLLGYSFGGIVVFEIARQLADRGEKVAFLGLVDIRSPTIAEAKIEISLRERIETRFDLVRKLTIIENLQYIVAKIFKSKSRVKSNLHAYRDGVVDTLSNLNIFTPELVKVLDGNIQAMKNYTPQVYSGLATIFWSEHQDFYIDKYPDLGWKNLAAGGLDMHCIPGTHITLMQEPHISVLAEKLKLCIDRAVGDSIEVTPIISPQLKERLF